MLDWRDLYSHVFVHDPVRRIVLLETQEVAFYVTERIPGALGPPLARATAVCAIFTVAMLAGFRFGRVRWLEQRFKCLRGEGRRAIPPPRSAGALAIGILAQIVIVARAGGPAASIESANDAERALGQLRPVLPRRLRADRARRVGGVAYTS